MTPAEFVQFMEELAPSIDELCSEGLALVDARWFRDRYVCAPRPQPLVYDGPTNEIVDLICGWDVSTLGIGMVEFLPTPVQLPNSLHVGFFEVDMLVVLKDSQEVYVVDEVVSTHLMWPVAATPDKCLDALAHLRDRSRSVPRTNRTWTRPTSTLGVLQRADALLSQVATSTMTSIPFPCTPSHNDARGSLFEAAHPMAGRHGVDLPRALRLFRIDRLCRCIQPCFRKKGGFRASKCPDVAGR